jgi:muramoyltetrapeptide carboxypeptidase
MPATVLWGQQGRADVDQLLGLLRDWPRQGTWQGGIAVRPIGTTAAHAARAEGVQGTLFGGCLSVLTNMIGTPYFPKSLAGHVVFCEDTGENPGRLLRYFNQWVQSGALRGAQAFVVGHLRGLGDNVEDNAPFAYERFAAVSPVPVFASADFGHTSPNYPLAIGSKATLSNGRLTWRLALPKQLNV